jgi:uncharacterized OB-fold protein
MDADSEPFWRYCQTKELRLQRCCNCGKHIYFPGPICHQCLGQTFEWTRLSGRGVIHTFTVAHRAYTPHFIALVPYVIAWVDLPEEEGLRILSNVVDCDAHAVRIGDPVEVTFRPLEGSFLVPLFCHLPSKQDLRGTGE